MKHIKTKCLLSITCLFFLFFANAQTKNYVGLAAYGGDNLYGCIFSGSVNEFKFATKYSFTSVSGANPFGSLVQDNDSVFYGLCYRGGDQNGGTIFRMSSNGVFRKIKDLTYDGGVNPYGSLVKGPDGKYYGLCQHGGANNTGTVFSFSAADSVYTKIMDFDYDTTGANPNGNLALGNDGNFYGMSNQGGRDDFGTIFKITPSGTFTKLKDFAIDTSGGLPFGSLVKGTDGDFYGMCSQGGDNHVGTIFKISASGTFTKLHDLSTLADGSYPQGSLIQAMDGNFYGMCTRGGANNSNGTVFKMTAAGAFTKLYDIYSSSDGSNPYGSLVQDSATGIFYGTCNKGGGYGYGSVFRFKLPGIFTRLADFYSDTLSAFPNGADPFGTLILTTATVKSVTGIAETSFPEVNLYPNPSQGVVTLTLKGKAKVEIMNALGRKEDELEMIDRVAVTIKGKGLYFVRIYAGGSNKVFKVMVE